MKKINLFAASLVAGVFFLASCGGASTEQSSEETTSEETTEEVTASDYTVDLSSSSVNWVGEMLGMYSHSGTIGLTEGSVTLKGTEVEGGNFTIDMLAINPTDDGYSEENPKEKLVGHLTSADFFNTAEYPTATFVIESVEGNTATGTLTVNGQSNSETVNDIIVSENEGGTYTVSGSLTFDRQKYGASWAHPVKENVLSDDITLTITLVTSN
jgi:polyisoprenoid-binding protein YceI